MTAHVYTVEETAKLLRIGRTAAYEAVRRGDIPSVRFGRSVRVPRHSLEALLGLPLTSEGPAANGTFAKTPEGRADGDGG